MWTFSENYYIIISVGFFFHCTQLMRAEAKLGSEVESNETETMS